MAVSTQYKNNSMLVNTNQQTPVERQLQPSGKSILTQKIPNTEGKILKSFNTFGLPEDYIELNIYDNTDILIAHIRDFKNYTFTEEGKTTEGLSNEVVVNPTQNLKDLNFNNGQFILEYRFQRKKIENTFK